MGWLRGRCSVHAAEVVNVQEAVALLQATLQDMPHARSLTTLRQCKTRAGQSAPKTMPSDDAWRAASKEMNFYAFCIQLVVRHESVGNEARINKK
jgi:hypothetical protein